MRRLVIPFPGNEQLAGRLATALGGEVGGLEMRSFPDGESYVRLNADPASRSVIIVCSLARPDGIMLRLLFTAATARELGATDVGLVAPYLAYMRQDARFKRGEAVSSVHFAKLLSSSFDWLVTVDPHLHRHRSLAEIYTLRSRVVQSAPVLSVWIGANVSRPLIVGPDIESEQWAGVVATAVNAPHVALDKKREGDRSVTISVPDLSPWQGLTPVLIDDIVSTARTMIEASRQLVARGFPAPVCVAVHALFAGNAYDTLRGVAAEVVTTNTISHPSNDIDIFGSVSSEVIALLDTDPRN